MTLKGQWNVWKMMEKIGWRAGIRSNHISVFETNICFWNFSSTPKIAFSHGYDVYWDAKRGSDPKPDNYSHSTSAPAVTLTAQLQTKSTSQFLEFRPFLPKSWNFIWSLHFPLSLTLVEFLQREA